MKVKRYIKQSIITIVFLAVCYMVAGGAGAAERVVVKSSIANMRSGPGTNYEVLWQVEKYHPFLVKEKKGKWVKIQDFEDDMAWIHSSLLTGMEAVITIKSKCNVRSRPTTDSKVLFTVERGVPFKVIKREGNWIRIAHADGEKGWIYKTLVW
ncbi:MAG TPA: SH3 domain-containing protein [Desulfotignum sp.]|nr:SH3 domain-containing protein [Desulfotignum sp.]